MTSLVYDNGVETDIIDNRWVFRNRDSVTYNSGFIHDDLIHGFDIAFELILEFLVQSTFSTALIAIPSA